MKKEEKKPKNPPCSNCGQEMKIGGDRTTHYFYCCEVKDRTQPKRDI